MRKTVLLLTLLCFTAIPNLVRANPPGKSQSNDTLEQRLDSLARKISDNLTENQKHTIAVVELSDSRQDHSRAEVELDGSCRSGIGTEVGSRPRR